MATAIRSAREQRRLAIAPPEERRNDGGGLLLLLGLGGVGAWWYLSHRCSPACGPCSTCTGGHCTSTCPAGQVCGPGGTCITPTVPCPAPVQTLAAGSPSGEIYVIQATAGGGVVKRHIANADVLVNRCHYDPSKIVNFTDAQLANCPTGPDVNATSDCPPAPMVTPPPPPGGGCTYTVVSGDQLIVICNNAYGTYQLPDGTIIWEWVFNNNPQIKTIAEQHGYYSNWWHWIFPGETIFLPTTPVSSGAVIVPHC